MGNNRRVFMSACRCMACCLPPPRDHVLPRGHGAVGLSARRALEAETLAGTFPRLENHWRRDKGGRGTSVGHKRLLRCGFCIISTLKWGTPLPSQTFSFYLATDDLVSACQSEKRTSLNGLKWSLFHTQATITYNLIDYLSHKQLDG